MSLAVWVPRAARTAGTIHPRLRRSCSGRPPTGARDGLDLFGELLDALLDNALKYGAPRHAGHRASGEVQKDVG